ncbi:MAG: ATPase, T2SS/T4P/T4SS family, partial [Lachnospiraceae bacterium]|nr:ATPase, T2SS/T4P/T4SS family [Lachnospiraceae bacterium]
DNFRSKEKLEDVIQQIVAKCNRVVNESSPIVDARLTNGSRVNVVLSPVALNGPILTIRRFPEKPIEMKDLVRIGSLSKDVEEFLKKLVYAKYNILISGGTGSGKTTFLNALSEFIPKDERIITIEDSAELQIRGIPNLVRLETRNANIEECKEISIRDLIKTALRMRPDRVIVGEVRGGEAIDMLQCFNTGHDGSISTAHANSAKDMLARLETMALMGMDLPLSAIQRQIASGVDIIIHLGRIRDKSRKVLEIAEICGYENGEILIETLYSFQENESKAGEPISGELVRRNELKNAEKWMAAGL